MNMIKGKFGLNKKVFGGFNFIVVLWSVLSLLSLTMSFNVVTLSDLLIFDVITFVIPVIFLLVLNLIIGIKIFDSKKDNAIWLLSVILAAMALVTVNTLNTRLADVKGASTTSLKQEVLGF